MSVITVGERARNPDGSFEVAVQFGGGGEHLTTVQDPLASDAGGEHLLTWYFEEHLRYPFLDHDKKRAAVDLLTAYGKRLFAEIFEATSDCSQEFGRYRATAFDDLQVEVVGGVDFHRLHWEALRNEEGGAPFGARVPVFRRVENVPSGFDIPRGGPTLNVLAITARPNGADDVGYRTISRPLLESLRQARVPVRLDLVRPGSWSALRDHLQATTGRHGSGWYGIVHFDVHGAVLSVDELIGIQGSSSRIPEAGPGSGEEDAYLFFETAEVGVAEPVSTARVADLLIEHRVPVVVLNACQSAMQSKGSEASLAQRLVEAGVPAAVGMAYSVTVSAAELMMPVIYKKLAEGAEILPAIHAGRRKLFDERGRGAYFDHQIDLEDWILPVVFSQRPVSLQPQPATPEQIEEIYGERSWHVDEPNPEYGFVGRDLDVQAIERLLLSEDAHNELLVSGMAGAGKSTLLEHLAWWWQATGLVKRVFSFSYEDRAWTVDQILQTIIGGLLDGHEEALARALPAEVQLERVAALLAANRHLLVLDNAESITGAPEAIPHSLPEEQRERLARFLSRLRGGMTLVLVGSRGAEKWLAPKSFESNSYELGGLDPQAASVLQERIISRHHGVLPTTVAERKALNELVEILGGYPLALSVVLPAIASTEPSAVLAELRQGGLAADPEGVIQRAIEFSHCRLDMATQNSLLVLAPFTGFVSKRYLAHYSELLQEHDSISALGELDIEGALAQAIGEGLASPDANSPDYIRLQPVLPFFLRMKLADRPALFAAINQAHHDLYQTLGPSLCSALVSNESGHRAAGQRFTHFEYANLATALGFAASNGSSVMKFMGALEVFLDQTHQQFARQQLVEGAIEAVGEATQPDRLAELAELHNIAGMSALSRHQPTEAQGHHEAELGIRELLDDRRGAGGTHHMLGVLAQERRHLDEAETDYRKALEIYEEFEDHLGAAGTYHQLGLVAQERRNLDEAEENYRKALEIYEEFDDRYEMGGTQHQLGRVAQERRHLDEAVAHYRKALEIFEEFDDHLGAAGTYHQLGRVAQERGHLDEAEVHYREALEIYEALDDRYETADVYHQLGTIAQEQDRIDEAETDYRKALDIFEEFDSRHRAASVHHMLGIVAQQRGHLDEADGRYGKALEIYEAVGDRYGTAGTYSQLGSSAQVRGNLDEADAQYLKALEVFEEFEDDRGVARTHYHRGTIAQQRRHLNEAEVHYREALEIFERSKDRRAVSITQSQLGILLTVMERITEAIQFTLAALSTRYELSGSWSELDLRWLKRQQKSVGSERFRAAAMQDLNEESFNLLADLLEEVDVPD